MTNLNELNDLFIVGKVIESDHPGTLTNLTPGSGPASIAVVKYVMPVFDNRAEAEMAAAMMKAPVFRLRRVDGGWHMEGHLSGE